MKKIILALLLMAVATDNKASLLPSAYSPLSIPGDEKKVSLSGYVKDATTGEELIGVSIFIQEQETGTTTNVYGYYSLTLEPGTYTVQFTYVGYQPVIRTIKLNQDTKLDMELLSEEVALDEVVVTSVRADRQVEVVQMSTIKMDISDVKKVPQLLGEVDLVRSIQLLPGVTTVGEGATGFNVRGGNIDENLILLDEAPVYNASHVLGFFSVFNADAIKDVQLQRGGIPATYGGRLSSVLDVRQKEGNAKRFAGTGGIGVISSRLMLEGPVVKEKSSFMVAGRRSYADIFTALSSDENIRDSKAYFYDLNAKINYTINDNNRLFLSGYFGRDVMGFGETASFDWGNKTASLRWNHLFGPKVFSNVTLVASDYDYALGAEEQTNNFNWKSNIRNYNFKADFTVYPSPNHTIDAGISSQYYRFKPGNVKFVTSTNESVTDIEAKNALESAAYVSHQWDLSDRFSLQSGLRFSLFHQFGQGTVYQYLNNDPTTGVTTGSAFYEKGSVIENFHNLEPRLATRYKLGQSSSIKASYHRMVQYVHLVSNTTASLPIDVWTPAGQYIKPAKADQAAIGYFRNFSNNVYEFSAETYYKKYYDLLDYKDGAELMLNQTLETEVLSGEGRAYGLELMLRKQSGSLTGWVSYTLSKTERRVEGINSGNYYNANYDKPHDLTIVLSRQLNEKWSLSGNFTYMTGRPITYPNARFEWQGITAPNYDNRNGARIPDYHRLDLSATYDMGADSSRKWKSSLTFGFYNVYGRRNPFSVYFRQNEEDPTKTEAVRYSLLGTVIPSITYNFNF